MSSQPQIIAYIDIAITIYFAVEFLFHLIVCGVWKGDTACMRDPFSWLDLAILVVSSSLSSRLLPSEVPSVPYVLEFSIDSTTFGPVATYLWVGRSFRPLRILNRYLPMKESTWFIISSVPDIVNVFVVVLLFFFLFAVLGVQLLKGSLWNCYVPGMYPRQLLTRAAPLRLSSPFAEFANGTEISNFIHCASAGGSWENVECNFDNVALSLRCLFETSTFEGWTIVLRNVVDSISVHRLLMPSLTKTRLASLPGRTPTRPCPRTSSSSFSWAPSS